MLRVVVPTGCCRDPLNGMFASPWYFHCHSPCRRRVYSPSMTYPTLAALIGAMEAMDTSCCDQVKAENACNNCSCRKEKTRESTDEKDGRQASDDEQKSTDTSPSSDKDQDSEARKTHEVSIPLEKLSDTNSDRFQVSLNLNTFKPENIEVKRVENELKILAKQEIKHHGMIFHREIQRSYRLPEDIDAESLKSTQSADGVLTVEALHYVKPKDTNDESWLSEEHEEESPSDVQESPSEELSPSDSDGSEGKHDREGAEDRLDISSSGDTPDMGVTKVSKE